jgi:hypothetical protein
MEEKEWGRPRGEELANTRTFFSPSEGWKDPLVFFNPSTVKVQRRY